MLRPSPLKSALTDSHRTLGAGKPNVRFPSFDLVAEFRLCKSVLGPAGSPILPASVSRHTRMGGTWAARAVARSGQWRRRDHPRDLGAHEWDDRGGCRAGLRGSERRLLPPAPRIVESSAGRSHSVYSPRL